MRRARTRRLPSRGWAPLEGLSGFDWRVVKWFAARAASLAEPPLAGGLSGRRRPGLVSPVTTITVQQTKAYTPKAPPGATDDYHCTLINPHVTTTPTSSASQFFPGSKEDHHAILFLVPPNLAAAAKAADNGGKAAGRVSVSGRSPAPGWARSRTPRGSRPGRPAPASTSCPRAPASTCRPGSLVVMQVHYNLLRGDKPVKNKLVLKTVPASTPLEPLKLDLMPAPPDIPCPANVTGPLCSRAASLANLGQRFGQERSAS